MPANFCPIPTSHTYADVKAAYDAAKKSMPSLTPAAWRKAAAQSLGIDYKTYLEIWKTKGKLPLVPASTPTASAAVPQAALKVAKTADNVTTATQDAAMKADALKKADVSLDATFNETVDGLVDTYVKGELDLTDVDDIAFDFMVESGVPYGSPKWNAMKAALEQKKGLGKMMKAKQIEQMPVSKWPAKKIPAKKAPPAKKSIPHGTKPLPPPSGVKYTKQGWELDNSTAKMAYKQMKASMPGATPAQIRKAAADFLGVDYKDYLTAWKKKPSAGSTGVKQFEVDEAASSSTAQTMHPTPDGKYSDVVVTESQLIDELAKLYGPNANRQYMNVSISAGDEFYTLIPKSLVPTKAGQEAVAEALRRMGFHVKLDGQKMWVYTDKMKAIQKNNIAQVAQTGTKTLPDGQVVLDMTSANKWTNDWWANQNYETRSAWQRYTGSGYSSMNRNLRAGRAPDRDSILISRSMPKTEHKFTVYRGTDIPLSQFREGELWSDAGFMSTAVNPGGAWAGVKFEITVTPGTKGMYIGNKSSHPGENEFLLDHGTKFRVLSIVGHTVKLVTIP